LLLLASVPVYRLLILGETGLAGRATIHAVDAQVGLLWNGSLLVLAVGLLAALVLPRGFLEPLARHAGRILDGPSALPTAFTAAGLGSGLATLFSWRVTEFRPNLIDGLTQLLHARYLASGKLAAHPDLWGPHWHVHNSILTDAGWISHFPPGHVALLALGIMAGAVWLVGPLLMGATAFFSVLIGDRILPGRRVLGRFAGLLVALSPFLLAHAGTYMSHATAAAFGTGAIYCGLRASQGRDHRRWATAAGIAVALVLVTRPLAGIVFGAIIGGIWIRKPTGGAEGSWRERIRDVLVRAVPASLGSIPILGLLLVYNARFTGSPLRLPYQEAFGSSVGLGFGRDPWGNDYGPLEALAYSSADLTALNLSLLEAPVPVVILVGLFLLLRKRLDRGEGILALWAGLPVLANGFFWHHGHFMGPRMLAEFAPGWILLTTAAVAWLCGVAPERLPGRIHLSPRNGAYGALVAALAGMVFLAPQRLESFGGQWMDSFPRPPAEVEGEALVFVHGSWEARLFAILATAGVRLDVVESALRQNPTCLVHLHALAMERHGPPFGAERTPGGTGTLRALDLYSRDFEHGPQVRLGGGPPIRVVEGERLAPECLREVGSDRFGVLEATALFWLGDLPGITAGQPMYLRDLGPERNGEILERYPNRAAFLYLAPGDGRPPLLLGYDEGMDLLWD
jgi:hypothetical protein